MMVFVLDDGVSLLLVLMIMFVYCCIDDGVCFLFLLMMVFAIVVLMTVFVYYCY